jgi:hypothetical protein
LPVSEIGRKRHRRPRQFLPLIRHRKEVREVTEVKFALAALAFKQKLLASRFKAIMQLIEKCNCLFAQQAFLGVWLSCIHMETPSGKSIRREKLTSQA